METDWLLLKAADMGGSLSRLTRAKELVCNRFLFIYLFMEKTMEKKACMEQLLCC